MQIERKIIKMGNSRGIILPAFWLKILEMKQGRPVTSFMMELGDIAMTNEIILEPADSVEEMADAV